MTTDERTRLGYSYAAAAYWFIEKRCHEEIAPARARQREITAWSFAVIRGVRPDIQAFTALLIQFPQPGTDEPDQVRPDNVVVIHPEPIEPGVSFATPFEPCAPSLVLEYEPERAIPEVYERGLQAPCYFLFDPDGQEVTLSRLGGDGYTPVTPNPAGRLPIPELELEAGLLDGWVRFWFRGELVPLPGDVLRERDAERQARLAAEAELARLREELARVKGQQP
jgi:hypothetical protein